MSIYKDMNYKELLDNMPADHLVFHCAQDDNFVDSLENDGYTEHGYSRTPQECSRWVKDHKGESGCEPTSRASWIMYSEKADRHYAIELNMQDDLSFEVDITLMRRYLNGDTGETCLE